MENEKIIENELPINGRYTDLAELSFRQFDNTEKYILKFAALPFYFLGMTADELKNKYKVFISSALKKVPVEKQTNPSPLIVGPLLEYVKYTFDNEQEKVLENMFSELLGNASNKDIWDHVQPSYVYTLQKLTWVEAELLKFVSKNQLDGDCLGVSFQRFYTMEKTILSVISNEAEPLIAYDNGEILNVFYQYYICVLKDDLMMSDEIIIRGLNNLQQLNLMIAFDIYKDKDNDTYVLDNTQKDNLNAYDSYKKITAYALSSYASDLMEICMSVSSTNRAGTES